MKKIIFMVVVFIGVAAHAQKICSELGADIKEQIHTGKVINVETLIQGNPLPQMTIYSKVEGTPKEAMSLFCSFDAHKEIFPGVKESKLAQKLDQKSWSVNYVMQLPLGITEAYTLKENLEVLDQKQSAFKLNWVSTKSEKMKSTKGNVVFEQVGGFTCMTYTTAIDLGDLPGLSLVKGQQGEKAQEAVEAFKKSLSETVKIAKRLRVIDDALLTTNLSVSPTALAPTTTKK